MSASSAASAPRPKKKYVRAVGPRLRILLFTIFGLVALLGANSIYLASITCLEWVSERWGDQLTYQNYFYLVMFSLHLVLGLLLIIPFLVFGTLHLKATRKRKNRRAVRMGYALFTMSLLLLFSGVLLVRVPGLVELKHSVTRSTVYWIHVACPLFAVWLYWLHRLAGPRIKWRVGVAYGISVAAIVLIMVILQAQDPRDWNVAAPAEGKKYFEPALVETRNGTFIPGRSLMNDQYCIKCHEDAYDGWFHSVHRLSSFNNPAYLASIRETRNVLMKRDGNVKASRFCAGCHDPVPFLSGEFDDPNYDVINHPTAHAGITCTVCHAITHVSSTRGNGAYVIEEPMHYPFAYSDNKVLQFLNNTLVKAKPSFHKKTFLKPFHKTAEFCSTCHKVHLPEALTEYKFLRGQNHYDSFLLSGVSGTSARSFYYPPKAQFNCNECHMPLKPSDDFGAKMYAGHSKPMIHDHTFLGANTALAWMNRFDKVVKAHQEFLTDMVRVDIFGVKEGGQVDGQLHAPLRPDVPALEPGKTYLLETVIRTLTLGHLFTQGTADSNEIWMDVTVKSGDRVIGRSGGMDDSREVDPWSHFVNVYMLDRNGDRISRRNAQDIFVPLYNNQIPPGAASVVHYSFTVPEDVTEAVTVEVRLNFRKFDKQFTDFMASSRVPEDKPLRGFKEGEPYVNDLPITLLAVDRVEFPLAGQDAAVENPAREIPEWQRWNDYGIGLLLKGKAELRQAADAFREVQKLDRYDGPLNLARAYLAEGLNDLAVEAITDAASYQDPPAPPWTLAWLSGLANLEQAEWDKAEKNFRSVLEDHTAEMRSRGFDFSRDYVVINELGKTLLFRAQQEASRGSEDTRDLFVHAAIEQFEKTLVIDVENVTAHFNLQQLYGLLGDTENQDKHRALHARYKPDDNARDKAVAAARTKSDAANHAAKALVIYPLQRLGAPGLPSEEARELEEETSQ